MKVLPLLAASITYIYTLPIQWDCMRPTERQLRTRYQHADTVCRTPRLASSFYRGLKAGIDVGPRSRMPTTVLDHDMASYPAIAMI